MRLELYALMYGHLLVLFTARDVVERYGVYDTAAAVAWRSGRVYELCVYAVYRWGSWYV